MPAERDDESSDPYNLLWIMPAKGVYDIFSRIMRLFLFICFPVFIYAGKHLSSLITFPQAIIPNLTRELEMPKE